MFSKTGAGLHSVCMRICDPVKIEPLCLTVKMWILKSFFNAEFSQLHYYKEINFMKWQNVHCDASFK